MGGCAISQDVTSIKRYGCKKGDPVMIVDESLVDAFLTESKHMKAVLHGYAIAVSFCEEIM